MLSGRIKRQTKHISLQIYLLFNCWTVSHLQYNQSSGAIQVSLSQTFYLQHKKNLIDFTIIYWQLLIGSSKWEHISYHLWRVTLVINPHLILGFSFLWKLLLNCYYRHRCPLYLYSFIKHQYMLLFGQANTSSRKFPCNNCPLPCCPWTTSLAPWIFQLSESLIVAKSS